MKEQFDYFLQKIRERDGEHEQAVLRVAFTFLFLVFVVVDVIMFQSEHIQSRILVSIAIYFVIAVIIFVMILVGRASSRRRQTLTMFADIGAVTYGMLITGETGGMFYGIYLWVIVGNGLRYGTWALVSSYISSLIGFSLVIVFNDYWFAHPRLSTGLMITLLLVPLYILKLRNQLNRALEIANEANKAKSQFLANMSHEMRTPLHGVVGAGDLLMATSMNAEQIDLTHTLQDSAQILLKLVDNVLDLAKIESGKLSTETIDLDLHQLVHSSVEMFSVQAAKKGIALNVRITPETCFALRGDALHVRQIIINLVGNAIKFTSKGMVELRVSTASQDESKARIRFEVVDTGIGIAPEKLKTIFESFTQADPTIARTYGGTGLGTTIANQLVQLMGGELGLSSEPGIGSVFWFELPFEKQPLNSVDHLESQLALAQLRVMAVGLTVSEHSTFADYLAGWDVRFEHETYLRSFFFRLKKSLLEQPEGLVVVCELQNLGISANDFVARVHKTCPRDAVKLMLFNPDPQGNSEKELLEMGYFCVLKSPLYKTVLFNALHGIMAPPPAPGAISLRDYLERKAPESHTLNILVADDNGTNRKIVSKMLELGGYKVELAEDGEQALEMLENTRYDLMILDLNMPVFGGLEVMKIHQASSRQNPRTPVAILTANATVEAIRECEEAGVDAYLVKPIEAVALLNTVSRLTAVVSKPETVIPEDIESGEIEDVPLVDEKVLERLVALGRSDANFMQTVVEGFISESERLLEAMQTAIAKNEFSAFKKLAHTIKGSSSNVGAQVLHQISLQMMQLDHAEFEDSAGELLSQAQSALKSTRLVLFRYLTECERVSSL